MIQDFIESWSLFSQSYVTGWCIAAALSLSGVLLVARNQIFAGAAVSQASALGVASILALGVMFPGVGEAVEHLHQRDTLLVAVAVMFAILAMLATSARNEEEGHESYESLTGWVFLFSASISVLLLANSPHGQEEIQHVLTSSIIGATWRDALVFSIILVATALLVFRYSREMLLVSLDPTTASACGLCVKNWNILIAVILGLLIGLSIPVCGMLYTFGCLVLPGLVAKNLCREIRGMFVAAPIIALVAAFVAFVLANHYDLPPAQAAVGLLSLSLGILWFGSASRTLIRR